jgi:hypothetical protein
MFSKQWNNIFASTLAIALVIASFANPALAKAQSNGIHVNQPVGQSSVIPGTTTTTGSADRQAPRILNVATQTTAHSVIISWTTDEISLGKVSWGTTQDYSDGQISVEQYSLKHTAEISSLKAHTQYYFNITAFDQSGNLRVYQGSFSTQEEPDTTPPQNASRFNVKPTRDHMDLVWQNPVDPDFDSVRIVRSERFYPADPYSGVVIYEGNGQYARDGAVTPGIAYYYSLFTRDKAGNYSPGSIGAGMILWFSESNPNYPDAPVVDINFPPSANPVANPIGFKDFTILYNHGATVVNNDNPSVPAGSDISLTVSQSALPADTSMIILSVEDKNGSTGANTFLFGFNKITKEFMATIPALAITDSYHLVITLFDSTQHILQTIAGSLQVIGSGVTTAVAGGAKSIPWSLLLLLFLIAAVVVILRHNFHWEEPPPPRKQRK